MKLIIVYNINYILFYSWVKAATWA